MAISFHTQTKSCLDDFATFLNINPLSFNNIHLSCVDNVNYCQFWQQETFQSPFNHESLAQYILQAENLIESYLQMYVKPTYTCEEIIEIPRYYRQENVYQNIKINLPYMKFQSQWKNLHEFGRWEKTLLGNTTITYTDEDFDGFSETATITLTGLTEDTINQCDLELSIDGKCIKICPFQMVSYINGTLILKSKTWLFKKNFDIGFGNVRAIDGCDLENFRDNINVYLWKKNLCLPQVEIVFNNENENCTPNCQPFIQPACALILDKCNGIFQIDYQKYDTNGCVQNAINCDLPCEPPNYIKVWHKSGCTDGCIDCNKCGVCEKLKRAIMILTATLLPQSLCSCTCAEPLLKYYQTNATAKATGVLTYNYPFKLLENPFGVTLGAIEVFQLLEQVKNTLCEN